MSNERRPRWVGRAGLLAGLLLWLASLPVLGLLLQAIEEEGRRHAGRAANGATGHAALAGILWGALFVCLQLGSLLTLTFVLRAAYRLRAAVCFAVGPAIPMVLDGLGLLGLLVWLRWSLGTR